MANSSSAPATARDWRLVALIGCAFFPASFALFYYGLPVGAWVASAPELLVSAFFAGLTTVLAMLFAGIVLTRRMQVHNLRMRVAINNMSQGLCMFDGNERLVDLQPALQGSVQALRRHREAGPHARRACSNSASPTAASRAIPINTGKNWSPPWNKATITHAEVKSADGRIDLGHQPADGRRRLGGDPRGHHRAARCRTRTRLDAGAAAAARGDRAGDRRLPPARRGPLAHGDRGSDGHARHRHHAVRQFRARPRKAPRAR